MTKRKLGKWKAMIATALVGATVLVPTAALACERDGWNHGRVYYAPQYVPPPPPVVVRVDPFFPLRFGRPGHHKRRHHRHHHRDWHRASAHGRWHR